MRLGHARPGVPRGDLAPAAPQALGERRVARDAHERVGERAGVAGGREQRAGAVAEEPAEDVEVGHDRGQPGGERLEDGEPEALLRRGQGEDVGGAVEPLELGVLDRAEHAQVAVEAELGRARVEAVDLVAVVEQRRAAGDEQHGAAVGQRVAGGGEALEQRERALARLDPADREDREPAVEARGVARGAALGLVAGGR